MNGSEAQGERAMNSASKDQSVSHRPLAPVLWNKIDTYHLLDWVLRNDFPRSRHREKEWLVCSLERKRLIVALGSVRGRLIRPRMEPDRAGANCRIHCKVNVIVSN
jgi:hypothetical protein